MDERDALRRNLVKQLFEHERIETTRAKAEAVRGQAERLITLAKQGNSAGDAKMVHARRLAAARLSDAESVKKLLTILRRGSKIVRVDILVSSSSARVLVMRLRWCS
jgi:ribosomal protein L17